MTNEINPFAGKDKPVSVVNAAAESDQQRSITETQAAMIIAKRFPRNQIEAMDKILQACTRPSLAETALYSYAKGGTEITGPSIRLAETAAQAWGNLQFGIRELDQRDGVSSVEAFAWDLETNVRQTKTFQVPHFRHTRQGGYALKDPRDIYELVANNGARRLRACILGVIPGDVIEAAQKQCEITLKLSVDTSPEAIQKMVETFEEEFGVTSDMIQKRIQCRIESIRPAQIVQMKKIYASLRDGMSKPSEWFDFEEEASAPTSQATTNSLKDKIKEKKAPKKKKDTEDDQKVELDTVLKSISGAKDNDVLSVALEGAMNHIKAHPDDKEVITTAYNESLERLSPAAKEETASK